MATTVYNDILRKQITNKKSGSSSKWLPGFGAFVCGMMIRCLAAGTASAQSIAMAAVSICGIHLRCIVGSRFRCITAPFLFRLNGSVLRRTWCELLWRLWNSCWFLLKLRTHDDAVERAVNKMAS